jgi:hypothetical protein
MNYFRQGGGGGRRIKGSNVGVGRCFFREGKKHIKQCGYGMPYVEMWRVRVRVSDSERA